MNELTFEVTNYYDLINFKIAKQNVTIHTFLLRVFLFYFLFLLCVDFFNDF